MQKDRIKALELQTLYISYAIKSIKGIKALDVFADVRGVVQHLSFTITDDGRYYSLGARVNM